MSLDDQVPQEHLVRKLEAALDWNFIYELVEASVVFVDSTHVKARVNSKKYRDETVREQTLWYEKELLEEIHKDREGHGKTPPAFSPEGGVCLQSEAQLSMDGCAFAHQRCRTVCLCWKR